METVNENGKRSKDGDNTMEGRGCNVSKLRKTNLHVILELAREMWGRDKTNTRSIANEDRDFREFFGCGPLVACNLWQLLFEHDLIPTGGDLKYFLWTLMFLKVYGKQRTMSTLAGVDKKTFEKWVWLFINSFVDLGKYVVSYISMYVHQTVYFLIK